MSHARQNRGPRPPVVSLISLGCAKNTVDSERLLAAFAQDGFFVASDPADSDVCLVNTCGFIEDAREETRRVLQGVREGRRTGRPRRLVALGCLVERSVAAPETAAFLDAADARFGFADYLRLPALCRALLDSAGQPPGTVAAIDAVRAPLPDAFHRLPRLVTGSPHSVSLKIAEGCSHRCRFCSIPQIRGPQVSRPESDILEEARQLVDSGARELCLIAQDTTNYGRDLHGRPSLAGLLRKLSAAVPGRVWFRLMYAHPKHLSPGILDALSSDPRFCPYLDLPLQHISDPMLAAMGRRITQAATRGLLEDIRRRWPAATLRSAFIVGHPGETDADFEELLRFVGEGHFLYAGVFAYSAESGTPSARMDGQVPEALRSERRDRLMAAQGEVTRRLLAAAVGRTVEAIVDGPAPAEGRRDRLHWTARAAAQAPDVDGVTYIRESRRASREPGDFVSVRLVQSASYDWVGEPADDAGGRP